MAGNALQARSQVSGVFPENLRLANSLKLPRDLRRQIVADALASPAQEICGLLAGENGLCRAAYPIKNVSPTPESAFFMDPQAQIDAMNAMRRAKETMLGIYHSHPRSAPIPSERDIAGAAYPGVACIIISLADERGPQIAAFELLDQGFREIELLS